jgi:hypothetical protein
VDQQELLEVQVVVDQMVALVVLVHLVRAIMVEHLEM